MKFALSLALFAMALGNARADVLRLLDGTELEGRFVGGSETEVWFQQAPWLARPATRVIPTVQVQSITFGPVSFHKSEQRLRPGHPMEQPPSALPATEASNGEAAFQKHAR
jgi:hypothetical protein